MGKVNLRKTEYSSFQMHLSKYHRDEITNIHSVIKKIRNLLGAGKAFEMESTTMNLLSLLDLLESEMLPLVEKAFRDTEQNVSTVITSFNNIDTLC